jgi:hypothetical protein
VPLVLYDNRSGGRLRLAGAAGESSTEAEPTAGLANVAATTLELLGFAAPGMWRPSLLRVGD